MPSAGLRGPFRLSSNSISNIVTKRSPGAYILGSVEYDGMFVVSYVGGSDCDVGAGLGQHIGRYTDFKYEYYPSARAAFEKVCRVFHDFGGVRDLNDSIHPARPGSGKWRCPVCDIFG
jgi:hypothetical protein